MNTNRLGCTCAAEQPRHDQQREPAEEVVGEQQVAAVHPVGEPAAGDRADDVEDRRSGRAGSALVRGGIPWSWAAGMKWVPIRPLVDQPQIQNVSEQDPERPRLRALSRSVRTATAAAPRGARPTGGAAGVQSAGAPYGVVPTSAGWSRRTTTPAAPAQREHASPARPPSASPGPSARCAIAGRKTSWPVELAAEKTPITTPRCRTNQRLATIAPKTRASEPVPMPTAKPHSSHSCQALGHHQGQPGAERRPATSAAATTRRTPKRSISAAANGAVRP